MSFQLQPRPNLNGTYLEDIYGQWRSIHLPPELFISRSIVVVIWNPNTGGSILEVDIEEIEKDDHGAATQEHRDGTEDPKEQREREVECPQTCRPEVASFIHHLGQVFRCHPLEVLVREDLPVWHIYQNARMAIVPEKYQNRYSLTW